MAQSPLPQIINWAVSWISVLSWFSPRAVSWSWFSPRAESWPWYRPVGDYPGIGFWREIQMSCLLGTCIHYFKTVKSWSSSIIMSWYDPWPRAHKKYTAFGLHGPALGLDLSVYGLGLVHAGLRRYIFRDPSARGRIISHCTAVMPSENIKAQVAKDKIIQRI